MANDGQVVFAVEIDTKNATASIKDITNSIEKESKKWDKSASDSANTIGSSFEGMLKKLAAGFSAAAIGKALLDFGKAAIEAASDLEEVQNVVDVTFGESAGQIDDWAKRAITQFGLTETQAKRFASTIGATLKSSGLAGNEINQISTDLAGLAADMASFYNMDFDTAFAKIRSGLSGETEPLKQLGINMSVANLEAFALSKGITKAFKDMSQGEQTMLRYQYLMQATADAQGDFARTSDGYANSMRLMETNIESIKTKLGEALLPAISRVVEKFNEFLTDLTTPQEKTIIDDFNQIDIDSEKKIAEIQTTAEAAQGLIDKLTIISSNNSEQIVARFALGANKLDSSKPEAWQALMNAFADTTGITNLFGDDTATNGISELAKALAGDSVTMGKAQAWQLFIGSLAKNSDAVSKLTGKSGEETAAWLQDLADKAAQLSPEDAASWDTFMTALVKGVDAKTPEGSKFLDSLASGFLSLGKDSDVAKAGLAALGFDTDQITQKQEEWLKTCKELVKTIPGLSSIIDTETGAVKGGIGALNDYVKEWQVSQEKIAWLKAYNKKQEAYQTKKEKLFEYEIDAAGAKKRLEDWVKRMNETYGTNISVDFENHKFIGYDTGRYQIPSHEDLGFDLLTKWEEKERIYKEQKAAMTEADEEMTVWAELAKEKMESLTEEEKKALGIGQELIATITTEGKAAVDAAEAALRELADYVDGIQKSVRSSIEGVFKPFEVVQTNTQKVTDLGNEIGGLVGEAKKLDGIDITVSDPNDVVTLSKMKEGLVSQIGYLQKYNELIQQAQSMGFSNEFLSQFTDGSIESYNYLEELVKANPEQVEEFNQLWADREQKTQELTKTLTDQKLTVDQVYQEMVDRAKDAVAKLDLEEDAATNSAKTVDGIVRGLGSKYEDVKTQVDSILSQMDRLASFGIDTSFLNEGFTPGGKIVSGIRNVPGFDTGLSYVPYDNFLARLHKGESILTAEENKVWQSMKAGLYESVDYDRLGGVMAESVKPGGNVYLDGRMVGTVISDRQGREYKSLQRSGWQA